MHLLPLDLTLTVGAGSAVLFMGLMAWWRNKWATGNVLFVLMALSLALWTMTDWFVQMQTTALPLQVFVWKTIFYTAVCFGPALAIHTAAFLARSSARTAGHLAYAAGFLSLFCLILGQTAGYLGWEGIAKEICLQGSAGMGLLLYAAAILYVGFNLYPLTISSASSYLERRRATYGIVILTLFLIAGSLQLFISPVPIGLILPLLSLGVLVVSLMAFVRVDFMDVQLGPLEAFFLLLSAYAVVILLRSRDSSEAWVAFLGSLIVGLFALLAISTVRGEQTKRRLLEDANRQLRMLEAARSDFIDMVAHQLRGPLGGIRSASSMISSGDFGQIPEKAAKVSGQIQETASRLLSLSDTFLNASRIEVGMYRTARVPTDVRKEVTDIFNEMSTLATVKSLELVQDIATDIPPRVKLDKEVLENALFNLVDNAVKYTDKGKVTVSCRLGKDEVLFSVSDTGPGLTQDDCRDLFRKFHRGKVGRMHQADGTGLGLYIVKKLVEAAGGTIGVQCAGLGLGTTFSFRLPFEKVEQAAG
jgi:signal transduction histidine kinase